MTTLQGLLTLQAAYRATWRTSMRGALQAAARAHTPSSSGTAGASSSDQRRQLSSSSNAAPASLIAGQRRQRHIALGRVRHSQVQSEATHSRAFSTSAPQAKEVDFLLADVGEGITECEIVEWYVQPGSHVEEFDMLVLLQTDKATVEVTSRYKGKITEHCYKVGDVARVGTPLCKIDVEGSAEAADEGASRSHAQPAAADDRPEEQRSSSSSTQSKDTQRTAVQSSPSGSAERSRELPTGHQTLATPAVRRLSRENGVDLSAIAGTGKDGRVTKDDVQQYISGRESGSADASRDRPAPALARSSRSSDQAQVTTVPLSGTRKAMFKAMTSTWTAPHFLYTDEIDVTALNELRSMLQSRRRVTEGEPKITLLPFLIKAMSLVLDDHPLFRSTLDMDKMALHQTDAHRFSTALASSRGLVTPSIPGDIREQSVLDIARSVNTLQQRGASERGLSAADMGAGDATITLSNIGSVGGTYTFPLLPPTGQLVIGGLGRARVLPRFDADGESIVKATILTASFAADHRVVEGVELARFVDDWKRRVEDPASWVLEMR